jgi:Kef-type K+ transport system membrane component KefB
MSMSLAVVELTRILLAIALLLGSAQFFGHFFFYFRLPRVIGEILGGLLLGPTVLGHFWPAWYGYIFQGFAFEPKLLGFVSSLGLFFLMFLSGFEIEHALTKRDYRVITILLLGATLLPFGAGLFS